MRNSQKGQDMLEVALLLPIMALFLFGIIYFGIAFGDYIKLNNCARSTAREAALIGDPKQYDTIATHHEAEYAGLVTQVIKQTKGKNIYIEETGQGGQNVPPNSIHVQIQTEVNDAFGIPVVLKLMDIPLSGYNVNYYMYKEGSVPATDSGN